MGWDAEGTGGFGATFHEQTALEDNRGGTEGPRRGHPGVSSANRRERDTQGIVSVASRPDVHYAWEFILDGVLVPLQPAFLP